MSDYEGISVVKDKGYQIPDGYLAPLTKAMTSVYGVCATPDKGDGLEIHQIPSGVDLTTMRQLCKASEKKRVLFYFATFPKDYLRDSIQPFGLLLRNGKPTMAITLVGDFKHHLPKESKHSAEFWACNSALRPKLEQIWRLVKEDPSAMQVELDHPQMKKDIIGLIGSQGGQITIMMDLPDGPSITHFQKSLPTYRKFTWGDTTNVLDYVTGIETDPKPEQIPSKPAEAKKGKKKQALIEDDAEEDKREFKGDTGAEEEIINRPIIKKDRQITLASGANIVLTSVEGKQVYLYYPPMLITQRKPLRKAYKEACGRTLSNQDIDKRVGVTLTNKEMLAEAIKSFLNLEVSGVSDALTGPDAPRHATPKAEPIPEVRTEAKETSPAKNVVTGEKVSEVVVAEKKIYPEGGSPMYSMTPRDKKAMLETLGTLDKNGQSIINPELFQEFENTTPRFIEDLKERGYTGFEQTLGWKFETRVAIAKNAPSAMAVWSGELIRIIYNLEKEIAAILDSTKSPDEEVLPPKRKSKKAA